jgi:peptidoglycan/xylan/chitin deacetylase (PgdA/CDA1 family)
MVVLLFVSLFIFTAPSYAKEGETPIAIGLHDGILPFGGMITHSKAYAPITSLAKGLKATITYNQSAHTYTLSKNSKTILIHTNRNDVSVNGKKAIPISLIQKENDVFLPIRWVAEQWGFKVDYLASAKTVRLSNAYPHLTTQAFLRKNQKEIQQWTNPIIMKPQTKTTVYLTFDDGPSRYSSSILHTLSDYRAKATFFYIEPNIRAYPSEARAALNQGNYLGLHSVNHSKALTYASPLSFLKEMQQTQTTLQQVTGLHSNLTRAPYGSKPYATQPYRDQLASHHLRMWDWTIDTEDWKYGPTQPDKILKNIQSQLSTLKRHSSKPIVILMHEQQATAKKLPEILDYLTAQGYEFKPYDSAHPISQNFWQDTRL